MPAPRISLILPIHNQADHVEQVVTGFVRVLDVFAQTYELLLVTNACTDASVSVCQALAAANPAVQVIELAEGGWGRAVRAGLGEASGEILCYTNAARTTPEILTLMLGYAVAYPDVVLKANRRVRDSLWRRLGSLVYNLECRLLFDLPVWDVNGTPKIFPRAYEQLLQLTRNDDLIDLEFNVICQREGYPLVEVPLLATVRHGGSSTTSVRSGLNLYLGAAKLRRQTKTVR